AIRVTLLSSNERERGCAMWDWGNSTWGGRVRVFGTVPVAGGAGFLWGRVVGIMESSGSGGERLGDRERGVAGCGGK
nr:hypothetical protein [Tanacetum cinerariifolium]